MHSMFYLAGLSVLSFASTVAGHGYIVSPPRRAPGTAMEAVCGSTIYNNQLSDNAGPVQLLMQSASSIVDAAECNLFLCKGYQFDDNKDQVQTYSLGQTVPFEVKIVAPHTGSANVSIVNTKTNTVIGEPLISWDEYASTSTGVTADETSFSVTLPDAVEGCTTAGECVLQWYWYAPPSVDQTYEGCVDFVIGDGTAARSSSAAATSAATSAAAATSSAAAATSAAATTSVAATTAPAETSEAATSAAVETSVAAPTSEAAPTTAAATTAPAETTAVAVPTTSSVVSPVQTTTAAATTNIPVTSQVPTTLQTRTRTTKTRIHASGSGTAPAYSAPAATGGAKDSASINKCLDNVNACIAHAQSRTGGTVNFSDCEAKRAACY